ncbi:hypothetical protein [Burkholderia sp. JKS000303]|uniref:hypothetical protein n=1 Tax=Burkholderia sp. JKS000303 TaxID=1938747 RepID=UPI000BF8D158|nr:hypothetical protein [Burkholderia sp. JKS000303]PFH12834.1 hypothetical protein BX604_7254 [Burkholderia sp. JKS000303]
MGVTFYQSTDASAPSLTGQVGSLIGVLDACLVNGYGSQSAAGWTKPYSGTNLAVYKNGSGSNGLYLDVNDNAPNNAREARMRGYEAMTGTGTGTNPFPTTSQVATAHVCRKSTTADSTVRPWYLLADATVFYLFVDTGDVTSPNYSMGFAFGDFFSYTPSDVWNTMTIGRSAENVGTNNSENLPLLVGSSASILSTTSSGHFLARSFTATVGSVQFCKHTSALAGPSTANITTGGTSAALAYPNPASGGLEMAPIYVGHSSAVRGYLKGLWAPLHSQPLGHGDTFTGSGNMSGKSFKALNMTNSAGGNGQIILETSNTWS